MSIAAFERVSQARYDLDLASWESPMPLQEIPLPRRATGGSAGYDFFCPVEAVLHPGESLTVPTGIRCRIEPGWVLLIMPRSSMGFKYEVRLSNTVGVIDSDYYGAVNEGHILIRLHNGGKKDFPLHRGDRLGQGLFLPYGLAEEDEVLARRTGGLGSTGK